jgi:hypothetical protein
MRLASSLRISFTQAGVETVRAGTLESISLEPSSEDGVPHLQLHVSTQTPETAQGTIEAGPPGARPTPAEGALLRDEPSTVVDPAVTAPAPAALPMREASDRDLTQRIELPQRSPSPLPPAPKAPALEGARRVDRGGGWRLAATGFAAGALVAGGLAFGLRRQQSHETLGPAAPRAEAPAAAAPVAPVIATPPRPAPSANINIVPVVAAPPAASEAPTQVGPFTITNEEGAPTIALALVGSTKGATRYQLAEPPGLAINIPRGRPRIAAGAYKLSEGGFRQILIQRRGTGSQIRLLYEAKGHEARARIERDAVHLVVRAR